ncbi:hypothetical protein [Nonomuraea recticatena]|uniref:hypothetical protein n=1 Tax=Nonomuraea recticatena TaxID=46178 RepID=UPI003615C8CE
MAVGPSEPERRYCRYPETVAGPIEDKRCDRPCKAREQRLPTTSHTTTDALQRYLRFLGPPDKADSLLSTLEDLAALFERSAVDGTPDPRSRRAGPVEFTEAFLTNHPQGQEHHRSRHKRQVVTKQRTDI